MPVSHIRQTYWDGILIRHCLDNTRFSHHTSTPYNTFLVIHQKLFSVYLIIRNTTMFFFCFSFYASLLRAVFMKSSFVMVMAKDEHTCDVTGIWIIHILNTIIIKLFIYFSNVWTGCRMTKQDTSINKMCGFKLL